ncbi:MAG TPA: DNA-3-methyladenine glycosylase, partial [Actinobacteria bacterium]|nr:DNA-3-methyladenine glycosylase [Actinomycetota bacterium]
MDLRAAIGGYSAGGADPSIALASDGAWLALRTSDGPVTLHFSGGDTIAAEAWGPGVDLALTRAPDICGANDDPAGFAPAHPVVARLLRHHPGVRITRSGNVVEGLLRMIVGQRVTGTEARNGYFALCRALGGPAPGPRRLLLPPDPARIAACGYPAFHPWGIERGRAETLIRVAQRAKRIEEAATLPLADAYARITAVRGVGPWTAAKVGLSALGDPDAVPVGDYHLPNTVAWALVGEDRADDARMLELLDEFRPHRGRVLRLLGAAGLAAPKYGPRSPVRDFGG